MQARYPCRANPGRLARFSDFEVPRCRGNSYQEINMQRAVTLSSIITGKNNGEISDPRKPRIGPVFTDSIAASILEKYDFGDLRSDLQKQNTTQLLWDVTASFICVSIFAEKSYFSEILVRMRFALQGYLAHKEMPTPLGPPLNPRHRPTVGS